MADPVIPDLFAGPGGWDEAARALGIDTVGLEWEHDACRTAVAAGHKRIRADVATYPVHPFQGAPGVIASPPCQAWSSAGRRLGEHDRQTCHELADRIAAGVDSTGWAEWSDPRSPLVCEPLRWVRDLRPEWVALEQVPPVLGLWEHFARILAAWGYSTYVRVLNAADYGVPQVRKRAILGASRVRSVAPPRPTHTRHPSPELFDERLGWVSMAQALGSTEDALVGFPRRADSDDVVTIDGVDYRARDLRSTDLPAQTVTEKARSWERFYAAGVVGQGRPKDPDAAPADTITGKGTAYWLRANAQRKTAVKPLDTPAPTITGGHDTADRVWITDPTHIGTEHTGRRVTVQEAAIFQSFPVDYPWRGSLTSQYQQVGNAIPPRLAAHVLRSVIS